MRSPADVSSGFEAGYPAADGLAAARRGSDRDSAEEWTLGELATLLWRRKALILATIGLVTLGAIIVAFQLTPRYSAQTKILVGIPGANVVDIEDVLGGVGSDQAAIESEIQILTSRILADKVVDALDLVNEPEFNPRLRPPSLLSVLNPLDRIPEHWRATVLGADSAKPAPEAVERQTKVDVRAGFQRAISVRIEGRSRVLSVIATSRDPRLAAALANTLSDLYLLEQLEAKFEATRRATDWLNDRVRELRRQVEASEQAVEEYRRQHGLIQSKDTTVTEQQLSEINTQLILAKTQTAEARARLRQVRSLVQSEHGVDSAAEVLASPLIQRLREREADIARQVAEMATEYGPRHPKMINIRAELEDIRARLGAEVEKIIRGLSNELEVARAREQTLERNLESLKTEAAKINASQGRLRVLEREAAANRALFDTFLARWKETGQQDEIQQADARIISRADVPAVPTSPRKKLIAAAALVLSVFLAGLLVLVTEQLDRGFRSSEQIEAMTGAGTLGLIPLLTGARLKRSTPLAYVLSKPASSFAESLRTLHTGLLLSDMDAAPRSVLITSSLPDEGKTTISITMARLIARSGRRVLLIDADLRRNQAATRLGLSNESGLVEVLAQRQHSLEDVIQRDERSGLHVLAAGGNVPSPPDLLGSAHMEALTRALRDAYDLVILDSPPVLVVSDARILARLADRTVFVIRWAETRRKIAALGLRQIEESGAKVAGVALNMVDVRKNARYAYADSGYYYGSSRKYQQYYTD